MTEIVPPPLPPEQQRWWAYQQRLAAHQAWLASTRNVGTVLASGLFVLGALRVVMMPVMRLATYRLFELVLRAPFVGAVLGGGTMAAGWWLVLANQPRRDQRVIALAGMLASVALAVSGVAALTTSDLLTAFTSRSMPWLEIAVTASALVGASLWRPAQTPATAIVAWVGLAVMVLARALPGPFGGGGMLFYGIVPVATWALAGVATLGMRALRPDLAPGMPSAILVQR